MHQGAHPNPGIFEKDSPGIINTSTKVHSTYKHQPRFHRYSHSQYTTHNVNIKPNILQRVNIHEANNVSPIIFIVTKMRCMYIGK